MQLGRIAQLQDRTGDAERYLRDAGTWLYVADPIGDRAFQSSLANPQIGSESI